MAKKRNFPQLKPQLDRKEIIEHGIELQFFLILGYVRLSGKEVRSEAERFVKSLWGHADDTKGSIECSEDMVAYSLFVVQMLTVNHMKQGTYEAYICYVDVAWRMQDYYRPLRH